VSPTTARWTSASSSDRAIASSRVGSSAARGDVILTAGLFICSFLLANRSREHAVREVEPRLHVTRAQASAGLEGGEAVHRGPGDLCPRAIGIRKCFVETRERQP